MGGFYIILKALFSGILMGIILSIPIGPAALESVKRTISMGIKEGLLVVLGAVSGDALDLILINFGIFELLNRSKNTEAIFWVISGIILALIGYFSIKREKSGKHLELERAVIENSRMKSMSYLSGFLMVLSNPLSHSMWITLSGTVIRIWNDIGGVAYYLFIFSILLGMFMWMAMLNLFALTGNKKISVVSTNRISNALMWIIFAVGIIFVVFGLFKLIL